jgi:DNA-directed RNA polymerase subunit RPC12/RpoP
MSTIIKCSSCGATLDQTETVCPYCEAIIKKPRENNAPEPRFSSVQPQKNAQNLKPNFSVGLFIFLLILFWPFALLYYFSARSN